MKAEGGSMKDGYVGVDMLGKERVEREKTFRPRIARIYTEVVWVGGFVGVDFRGGKGKDFFCHG